MVLQLLLHYSNCKDSFDYSIRQHEDFLNVCLELFDYIRFEE